MTAVTIAYREDSPFFQGAVSCLYAGSPSLKYEHGYFMRTFSVYTEVTFADLSEEVIAAYVATGEPMDKAGGYGIQGLGSSFVSKIDGCYFNIVGFPIHKFCEELSYLFDGKRKQSM